MKHINLTSAVLLCFALILPLGFYTCTEPSDEDPDPNNNLNTNADPDKITGSLKFKNATTIAGTLPTFTPQADLKIWEGDTIYWVKDIIKRIRIKKPPSVSLGSLMFYVEGSASYVEVPFQVEEETDSVAVFYFDFNTDGWDFPIVFDVTIVPKRDDGTPMDPIGGPIHVDEQGSDCSFTPNLIWEWIYTTENGIFKSGPMFPQSVDGTIAGCCDSEGNSFYDNCFNTSSHRVVNYETSVMVQLDYLKLFAAGDVGGELIESTQNVNPQLTDFCGGTPGYNNRNVLNSYVGRYTLNTSNCKITIESLEGQTEPVYASDGTKIGDYILPIYAGFGTWAEYTIINGHFMKETRQVEGGSFVRMYEARNENFTWRD
ncbi:MAG: hypothetical protein U5K79_16180 [Cyclobacteriaceae bacterium]|nr:hypothetical protein [Cyclobacteriaceae bacterium]